MSTNLINRMDGVGQLLNPATGMGMNYDPTTHTGLSGFTPIITRYELSRYYREFGIMRKIVDTIPNQMARRWGKIEFGSDGDPKIAQKIDQLHKNFPILSTIHKYKGIKQGFNVAQKWANKQGNAAIILGIDDGTNDFSRPVRWNKVKSVRWGFLLDHYSIQRDFTGLFQGRSQHFIVRFSNSLLNSVSKHLYSEARIHEDRVIWFRGQELDDEELRFSQGYDDSVMRPALGAFRRYQAALQGAERMTVNFDLFVNKISKLFDDLDADGDGSYEEKLKQRAKVNNLSRSMYHTILMDRDLEDGEFMAHNVSGYDGLLRLFLEDLQANTDLQPSELLGKYPEGLAATGQTEQQNSNSRTEAYQVEKWEPKVNSFNRLLALSADVGLSEDDLSEAKWKWHLLNPRTPEQEAELMIAIAQADASNIQSGVYSADDAANSHYADSELDVNVTIDFEARKKQQAEDETIKKKKQELEIKQMEQSASPDNGGFFDSADERIDSGRDYLLQALKGNDDGSFMVEGINWTPNQPQLSPKSGYRNAVLAVNGGKARIVHFNKTGDRSRPDPKNKQSPFHPDYWRTKPILAQAKKQSQEGFYAANQP